MGNKGKRQKPSIGGILGSVEIIDRVGDVDEFGEWLQNEFGTKRSDKLLDGYKFFTETAFRVFLHQTIYSKFPLIQEDFVFFRARFEGVRLTSVPNTCEKTAFIKNINDHRRSLRKADSWEEVQTVLDDFKEEVVQPFQNLFENHTFANSDYEIEKAKLLRQKAIFQVFTRFNDVGDGYPNGYYITVLDTDLREERLESALEGYSRTLQFVWSQLVGDEVFKETCLSELHKSERWSYSINVFDESGGIPDERADLDRFFGEVEEGVVRPLEAENGVEIMDDVLFLDREVLEDFFTELTSRTQETGLDTQEEFDYQLLWYQVEFLRSTKIFNGVPAFISLMGGTVNQKKRFADGEKAYVCKFTHPVEPGNDYTYGVLVEASGSSGLADYSGWVMFYDCCGDYSGFSGSEHIQAETLIENHLERDEIILREMELEKDEFKEMVSDMTVGERGSQLSEELDQKSETNRRQTKLGKARGLLVELISYYYLTRKDHSSDNVDWNISFDAGELDVQVETPDEIRFIECKYDPSNQDWEYEFNKLEDKVREPESEKSRQGEFWFWSSPPQETVRRLEEEGYRYKVVSEVVRDAPEFRDKDLEHLMFVMEKIEQDEHRDLDEDIPLGEL
ncbi:hypothetical protein [Halorhabdus salina]|uniref:hypothetical protein n=1 Tax=Halorhabdus salina TaxID=2750670 RepID=UPI0015EFC887|nr:hypothetical protein [Halorhabdus salina]